MPERVTRRRYDNSGRAAQAAANRAAVLRAGHQVLVARGYSGATIAAIARAAGVSVETVYKGFGSKPELVREILGNAVVGNDEPVVFADRADMQAALHAGAGPAILSAFAEICTGIMIRVGPLLATLLVAGRAGEPEVREIAQQAGQQRLADITRVVEAMAAGGDLRPDLDVARAADIVWSLGSPEVHQQLTVDRGWTPDEYQEWLTRMLQAALLRPS